MSPDWIHTVETCTPDEDKSKAPLVIMHGYGNGIGYLFPNLVPLASKTRRKVFGIDMLGFGLSSRPEYLSITDRTTESSEAFFVDSLERWRESQKIDKMVLCGHSLGGYLSTAYTEKYPERVERLVLLSPVGVPEFNQEESDKRMAAASWKFRWLIRTARGFWGMGATPMGVIKKLPEGRGKALVDGYVYNRLKRLQDDEKEALSSYFYSVSVLPASGELCLQDILLPGAMAKKALVDRIPKLKVPSVHFLYGQVDWMDFIGGVTVQEKVEAGAATRGRMKVDVRVVEGAGHLLNLENPVATNAALTAAVEGMAPTDFRVIDPKRVNKEERSFTRDKVAAEDKARGDKTSL
jgi:cardiolipin-specific phospholipase